RAMRLDEVKPPHDTNAFSDLVMHAEHFVVACRGDELAMKVLIHAKHHHRIAFALRGLDAPNRLERFDRRVRCIAGSDAFEGGEFEHDAQIVELIELLEVDLRHFPATAKPDFEVALAL